MSSRSLVDEESKHVADAIRELIQAGESQTALGPRLGVTQPNISALLAGRHNASLPLVRNLAKIFGVSIEDLLVGRRSSSKPKPTRDAYPARAEASRRVMEALRRMQEISPPDGAEKSIEWWEIKLNQLIAGVREETEQTPPIKRAPARRKATG